MFYRRASVDQLRYSALGDDDTIPLRTEMNLPVKKWEWNCFEEMFTRINNRGI